MYVCVVYWCLVFAEVRRGCQMAFRSLRNWFNTMWVLGTQFRSSTREASARNP